MVNTYFLLGVYTLDLTDEQKDFITNGIIVRSEVKLIKNVLIDLQSHIINLKMQ